MTKLKANWMICSAIIGSATHLHKYGNPMARNWCGLPRIPAHDLVISLSQFISDGPDFLKTFSNVKCNKNNQYSKELQVQQ